MSERHSPITGFRIAQPAAKRGRTTSGHRPIRLSEARQLIEAFVTNELHHSLARVMRKSVDEHNAQPAAKPTPLPQRKVFNVARIDHSKSQLPIISDADAEAIGRRETLMHFGLDPDQ
ncbi:hypothetical protein WI36_11765 [Burkholderia ubonensis]|uniref:hypothetical protein n=1 Tax=Burkholderia ubonensis TaxID=101571 RepID=UPI0007592179|nr:hypothetical protein [Burkholderia ubonensis]KUZ75403.1 hypothetical protein WI36_11765 [Burkholderia ubonensis]